MPVVHTPSPDSFVIQGLRDVPDAVAEKLKSLGSVEEVSADVRSWILKVRRAAADPRQAWTTLREQIAALLLPVTVFAEPVLLDERGQPHLPTGEVAVRFLMPQTDAQLEDFAAGHGLRLRSRNAYVPEKAVFIPRDPSGTYLPDLVARLRAQVGVETAWACTLSRYRRAAL
jgi:hypothetical protein